MDIIQQASELFLKNLDSSSSNGLSLEKVTPAIKQLLSNQNGDIDLAGMISQLQSSGLTSMVNSWLGDGSNNPMDAQNITNLFDSEKITSFATTLNLDTEQVVPVFQKVIPALIDTFSNGGSLSDLAGDILGSVSNLFG